jgi:hypothetical protein
MKTPSWFTFEGFLVGVHTVSGPIRQKSQISGFILVAVVLF